MTKWSKLLGRLASALGISGRRTEKGSEPQIAQVSQMGRGSGVALLADASFKYIFGLGRRYPSKGISAGSAGVTTLFM